MYLLPIFQNTLMNVDPSPLMNLPTACRAVLWLRPPPARHPGPPGPEPHAPVPAAVLCNRRPCHQGWRHLQPLVGGAWVPQPGE